MRVRLVVVAAALRSKHVSEQGSKCWYAAADNSKVGLYGCPDPKVEALPGDIVGFIGNIMGVVCAHRGREDNDEAEREDDNEGHSLGEW